MLFSPLYVLVGALLGEEGRKLLLLQHQVLILQRQLGKRPALIPTERLALVLSSLRLSKRRLLEAVMIVRPDTLVGWHRELVRRHRALRSRSRPGRPPEITPEMESLVVRIARENPRMGYTKIAGEMRKLGFAGFGRSSVARILSKHGLAPRPAGGYGLSWKQFLGHYHQFLWASDFFTVTAATLRTYHVIFLQEVGSRRIRYWNLSSSPDEAWVVQQFRNLSVVSDDLPRCLIHDRDSKFTRQADSLLRDAGTEAIRLPARSPDLNPFAERWIRTARQACLDRIILLNERHLRWVLTEYLRYYHQRRPHRSLRLLPPAAPPHYPREGEIRCRPILGGLINDYYRDAA